MRKPSLNNFLAIILIGIFIVAPGTSCKKNDTDPKMTDPRDNFSPKLPDIHFKTSQFDMQTDYEKENDIKHNAHLIGTYLAGIDGNQEELYGSFLGIGMDIIGGITAYEEGKKAYSEMKNEYKKIQNDINQVKADIAKIENEIKDLIKEIKDDFDIEVDELELDGEFSLIDQEGAAMDALYGSSALNGSINYFSTKINDILNDPTIDSIVAKDSLSSIKKRFIDHFATDANIGNVQKIINTIQTDIGVGEATDVLNKTTDLYILKNPNPDSATALRYYAYIEKRLLKAFHHQIKGLVINSNIINAVGTDADLELFQNDFKKVIQTELQLLKDVAYRLVINSTSLNAKQYGIDMNYVNYGIAPDNEFINLLARMAFTCSLIEGDGDSLNNAFAGVVYTPNYYYKGGKAYTNDITLKGSVVFGDGGQDNFYEMEVNPANSIVESQIPYTKWTTSDTLLEASPDNGWIFYYCEVPTQSQFDLNGKYTNILRFDEALSDEPWVHNIGNSDNFEITGEVWWYDPNDPDMNTATPTKTKQNIMPFGFFSMRWLWGHQALSQSVVNNQMSLAPIDGNLVFPFGTADPNNPPEENPSWVGWEPDTDLEFDYFVFPNNNSAQCYNSFGMYANGLGYDFTPGLAPGCFVQFNELFSCSSENTSTTQPMVFYTYELKRQGSFYYPEDQNTIEIFDQAFFTIDNGFQTQSAVLTRKKVMDGPNDTTMMACLDSIVGMTTNSNYRFDINAFHWENGSIFNVEGRNCNPLELRVNYSAQVIYTDKFKIVDGQ